MMTVWFIYSLSFFFFPFTVKFIFYRLVYAWAQKLFDFNMLKIIPFDFHTNNNNDNKRFFGKKLYRNIYYTTVKNRHFKMCTT